MENMARFKFQIIKYTLIAAIILEVGSIPILGFSLVYLCGLISGTLISIMGFLILLYMSEKVLSSGVKWMASLGTLLQLPFYGVAFYICMKTGGLLAGVACVIGFMTTRLSMIYVHGIKSRLSARKKSSEGE